MYVPVQVLMTNTEPCLKFSKFVLLNKTGQVSFLARGAKDKAQHTSIGLNFPPKSNSSMQPSFWDTSPNQRGLLSVPDQSHARNPAWPVLRAVL